MSILVLVGESASGKTTIEKALYMKNNMKKVVSYTTRPPRKGEVDGVDYHFISQDKFLEMKENNEFIEIGAYRGWWYGSKKEQYTNNTVAVLTPHGLRCLKKEMDDIVSFYIKVPRRDRLIKILERGDDVDEAIRRNQNDVGMYDGIEDEVSYVIWNNGYMKSARAIVGEILTKFTNISGSI